MRNSGLEVLEGHPGLPRGERNGNNWQHMALGGGIDILSRGREGVEESIGVLAPATGAADRANTDDHARSVVGATPSTSHPYTTLGMPAVVTYVVAAEPLPASLSAFSLARRRR